MTKWYPQTWMYVGRFKKTAFGKFIQRACGKITGHEASKTEKDYPGNGMVGQWCRWCDYFWEVPLAETPSAEPLRDAFENFNHDDFEIVAQRCGDCGQDIPFRTIHHCPLEN